MSQIMSQSAVFCIRLGLGLGLGLRLPSCFSRLLISEYPGYSHFRKPIRARGKQYSLVEYMLIVDIYRETKRRGIYLALGIDPEGDSCFLYLPKLRDKMHFIFKK